MIKKYTHHRLVNVALILCIVLGVSCKSKKIGLVDSSGMLKSKSHNEVLDDILTHELNYNTIMTKGSVSLAGKKFTTIFKIVKDEVLQASVRPLLGIEAMRIDITPEKIILIDRLEGRYAELDIQNSELSDMVALNFFNLQALLTNQLFVAGNHSVEKSDYPLFEIGTADNQYILQTKDKNNLSYMFTVDVLDRITSSIIRHDSENISLKWDYDQFVEDKDFVYPTVMNANISLGKRKIAVGISYSSLDINTDFSVDTSISSKYKKVEIRDLLESYMKMK